MADTNGKPALPPYVSFRTFLNFLDRLEEGGVPQRIDRSYWGEFLAGGLGAQLMVGLRGLGLINGDSGEPTPLLEALVNRNSRKQTLLELLHARYASIFASVDLTRGTTALLDEAFRRDFKTDGDTHRKVVIFFIHAAQYAGISVADRFTKRTRSKTGATRRLTRPMNTNGQNGASAKGEHAPTYVPADEPRTTGSAKMVKIRSGGSVTLTVSVDFFELSMSDRDFVLSLMDQMRGYADQVQEQLTNLQGVDASRPEVMA